MRYVLVRIEEVVNERRRMREGEGCFGRGSVFSVEVVGEKEELWRSW